MLVLPIKKKWFDMILSGEKKEEYRDISDYWKVRFANAFGKCAYIPGYQAETRVEKIMFRNGYNKNSPSFIAECTLKVDEGREEWGAEKGKEYFVLTILRI